MPGDRPVMRTVLLGMGAFAASIAAAAVLATVAGVGQEDDGGDRGAPAATAPPTSARSAPRPTAVVDDRRLAATLLPRRGTLGAGWLELNRDPEGPDDPTLPTAPAITGECGGERAVADTGTAFSLLERRRGVDLDEQVIVYGLLFASVDDANAQAALFRSATLEGCIQDAWAFVLSDLGADVAAEDIALPPLEEAQVDATGRVVRATATVGGFPYEGRSELTVLHAGRAVVLVVRDVAFGAPDPFPIDGAIEDIAAKLAQLAE